MSSLKQIDISPRYLDERQEVLADRIMARKKELGDQLLILCHHYQQEAVFRFADMTGDSLKLAKHAAVAGDRSYIVFCGVHFMAESADILTTDEQSVMLPDLRAGCPMADMATSDEVSWAWRELEDIGINDCIPVTYVNSSARIKAFVGAHGGSVCTSSNAERVLTWALKQGNKIFFLPDEHLGRNSAHALGITGDEVVLWQRGKPLGGNSAEALQKARVLLWDGYCTVHMQFRAEHIRHWRETDPEVRVIVHPECTNQVVNAADFYGSTEQIIKRVSESPAGSKWAIGTEINLVNRLAARHPDKSIHSLAPFQCLCSTMYRIKPGYLLWVLDNLVAGTTVNRIIVDHQTAELARIALDRMLRI
ncbi:MAG: quinolinate synthase NadA [Desulfobacterales bacterium]|nr:quinolinate synthase NadA [Desulfobacterales bacterium]